MGRYGRDGPATTEVDAQRALLDSLMGMNRNHEGADIVDYKDDRLCRPFLHGICPIDGFINTKMACGSCDKIHSEEFKEQFQNSSDKHLFDDEVFGEFSSYLADAERIIKVSYN